MEEVRILKNNFRMIIRPGFFPAPQPALRRLLRIAETCGRDVTDALLELCSQMREQYTNAADQWDRERRDALQRLHDESCRREEHRKALREIRSKTGPMPEGIRKGIRENIKACTARMAVFRDNLNTAVSRMSFYRRGLEQIRKNEEVIREWESRKKRRS